jgi:hypothetical protein
VRPQDQSDQQALSIRSDLPVLWHQWCRLRRLHLLVLLVRLPREDQLYQLRL